MSYFGSSLPGGSEERPAKRLSRISTTCRPRTFVRQLGNTFGVTAATVIFGHRLTLHSSRLLDVANRLDPTVQSTLSSYSGLIVRNGGAGSNPALGALQLFQANIITQSRLLSYIDIYLGLAVLSGVAVVLLAMARLEAEYGPDALASLVNDPNLHPSHNGMLLAFAATAKPDLRSCPRSGRET